MTLRPGRHDVVVRQTRVRNELRYVLRTPSCPDQIVLRSRDAACAHAVAFARFAHLGAWFEDEAQGLVLLGSFREGAAAKPAGVGSPDVEPTAQSYVVT